MDCGRRRRGRRNPDRSIAAAMLLYTFHVSLLVRQARPIRYHHLADLVPRGHLGVTVVVLAAIHIVDRWPPLYFLDKPLRVEHAHRTSRRFFSSFLRLCFRLATPGEIVRPIFPRKSNRNPFGHEKVLTRVTTGGKSNFPNSSENEIKFRKETARRRPTAGGHQSIGDIGKRSKSVTEEPQWPVAA